MGLIRIILITLAVVLVIRLARRLLSRPAPVQRDSAYGGHMVRCAHCGLHVPEAEAVKADNLYYCSPEHRDKGKT